MLSRGGSSPVFTATKILSQSSPLTMPIPTSPGVVGPGAKVILPLSQMLCPLHTSSVLERARQSTRIKKRKQNLANKKKKEERLRKNPPPMPKKIKLMLKYKGIGDKLLTWRRQDFLPFATDTAWSEKNHTWNRMTVEEGLECLREHCHPTMLNIPDAMVWAKLEFNMANVKKDKYLEGYSKMTPIYYPYERGVAEKQILVFCKKPEEIAEAEKAGAKKAGGSDLVQDILKGKTDVSDFDHFLTTEEMFLELKPLVGILRDKYPKKNLGTVSNEIERLVKTFAHGMLVSVKKAGKTLGYEDDPSYASSEVTIGRLNQKDEEIRGNLTTLLETLRENAPKRAKGGFITRCELYIEDGLKSKFSIIHDLVDDERYKDYIKEMQKVSKVPDLEPIKEESVNS